ncbi:MAG: diguanylate cyclase [Desulfobacteraceae bacterium]|nr:MAG: diguanylate cyclase [Desulfobacteraceae bacterium]
MNRTGSQNHVDGVAIPDRLSLLDLIPLEDLQHLQDALAEIGRVKSVISDPDGHILTMPSNDIPVCKTVMQSSRGSQDCLRNLQRLSGKMKQERRAMIHHCESVGILKAAVPIVIQNMHLANWWISQYCTELANPSQMVFYARQIGLNSDTLLHAAEQSVQITRAEFEKALNLIGQLAQKITLLGYKNLMLLRDNSKLNHLQSELDRYKSELEKLIQARTVDLVNVNKRLKLEVLERDLVEEQIARKSKLLDAINQVLHQVVADRSEQSLAGTCLRAAQVLTASPFGFMVEHQEDEWQVVAYEHLGEAKDTPQPLQLQKKFEVHGIWSSLVQTGKPVTIQSTIGNPQWRPLPEGYPKIKTLMAVPLPRQAGISGFIALANNPRGYALIDQTDVESLAKAFSETLMRTRAEQANHHSEKRFNLALDSADEGLWDYLPQKGYVYYSPRWFTMLGYSAGELPYSFETWSTLTHPEDLPVLRKTFAQMVPGLEDAFGIELRMLSQAGQWRWMQTRGRTVERDADGRALRIVGTLIDISKYKQVEMALQKANEELQRLAALDDLTQIANRRRFDERLADEWRRARRDNTMLAVVICDIDFFKRYNDTYGHVKGDDTLYAVAQAINAVLKRPMDLVARYGGEEFAMVLPNTDLAGATRVANEVKAAIETLQIPHEASRVVPFITLSFGVAATIPQGNSPAKMLVEQADKALYKAKAQGRHKIVQADPAIFTNRRAIP